MKKLLTLLIIFSSSLWAQTTIQEQECVNASLSILDKWEYDDRSELLDIISSCQNSFGKECLLESIKTLSSNEFDDRQEVTSLNTSCRFVDVKCLQVAKSFLRRNDIDDRNEITQLNQLCQNTNHQCLRNYCELVDSKNCDSYFYLRDFAQYCKI